MHNRNLYREIFLNSKKQIDKKLARFSNEKAKKYYLENTLKNEILKSEEEIRIEFNKINCANCGACCSLAISEFSPDELQNKAKNNDKTSKSFLDVFELYKDNSPPENLLPKDTDCNNTYFYHCKKVIFQHGKSFCPIYEKRPQVCRSFPDTPLENLPKSCAFNKWKEDNETKALFIKALNDIRKFYLEHSTCLNEEV